MDKKQLSEAEIASLTPDECFEQLIGQMKEMSREELMEFAVAIKAYKALKEMEIFETYNK